MFVVLFQKQVDSGIPVGPVLRLFCQWMEEIKLNRKIVFPSEAKECGSASSSNLCTVVTWSGMKFNSCHSYNQDIIINQLVVIISVYN